MARIGAIPKQRFEVTLTLSEEEARALKVFTEYEVNAFLSMFYEKLGKHYLEPYQNGVGSLFTTVREQLPPVLRKFDEAREVFASKKN